jgi:cysteine desulfurase
MTLNPSQLSALREFLVADEIIDQSSPSYAKETKVWAYQKNQKPMLVLRPKSLQSLQKVVKYLCRSTLDFGVRSGGVGSSSGKDVVLSMTAFDDFIFDTDSETVILGAGQTWGDVDRKMEDTSPIHIGMYAMSQMWSSVLI